MSDRTVPQSAVLETGAERAADPRRWQRDVYHRQVKHDHELGEGDCRKDQLLCPIRSISSSRLAPAAAVRLFPVCRRSWVRVCHAAKCSDRCVEAMPANTRSRTG